MKNMMIVILMVVVGVFILISLGKDSEKQGFPKKEELEKRQLLLPEKWNKIFNEMTPAQHLSAIKRGEEAIYGHMHLEALAPGSPERKEAENYLRQKAKDQEVEIKAERTLQSMNRKSVAHELELIILDKLSMDTKVNVEGQDNTTLRIKGVLIGRAMAYQMFNKAGIGEMSQKRGFKIVIFENSIDHSWWKYTLD